MNGIKLLMTSFNYRLVSTDPSSQPSSAYVPISKRPNWALTSRPLPAKSDHHHQLSSNAQILYHICVSIESKSCDLWNSDLAHVVAGIEERATFACYKFADYYQVDY